MTVLALQKKSGFYRILESSTRDDKKPLGWEKVLDERQQKLILGVLPAARDIAFKFTPRLLRRYPDRIRESYDQCLVAAIRCAHNFDPGRGLKFITMSYGAMQRQVYTHWKQKKAHSSSKVKVKNLFSTKFVNETTELEDELLVDRRFVDQYEEVDRRLDSKSEAAELLQAYNVLKSINERDAEVVALRIGLDGHKPHSLIETCEIVAKRKVNGATRQRISQRYYNGLAFIKEEYERQQKTKEAQKAQEKERKEIEEFQLRNSIAWDRMVSALPELQAVATEGVVLEMLDESRD
jgi:hypothetical protein